MQNTLSGADGGSRSVTYSVVSVGGLANTSGRVVIVLVGSNGSSASGSSASDPRAGSVRMAVGVAVGSSYTRVLRVRESLVDLVGTSVKLVVLVVAGPVEVALLPGKLVKGLCGKSRGPVVNGLGVVRLVDRDGCVYNVGLDSLLLDDGLDVLVDVVVDALARDDGGRCRSVGGVVSDGGVLELGVLAVEGVLGFLLVSVLEGLVCDGDDVVVVLLGADVVRLVDVPENWERSNFTYRTCWSLRGWTVVWWWSWWTSLSTAVVTSS